MMAFDPMVNWPQEVEVWKGIAFGYRRAYRRMRNAFVLQLAAWAITFATLIVLSVAD